MIIHEFEIKTERPVLHSETGHFLKSKFPYWTRVDADQALAEIQEALEQKTTREEYDKVKRGLENSRNLLSSTLDQLTMARDQVKKAAQDLLDLRRRSAEECKICSTARQAMTERQGTQGEYLDKNIIGIDTGRDKVVITTERLISAKDKMFLQAEVTAWMNNADHKVLILPPGVRLSAVVRKMGAGGRGGCNGCGN